MPGKNPPLRRLAWKIHRKSECVMTVVPTLAAASQADYKVGSAETSRLRIHGLPPSGERMSRVAQD